jgi:hypothetical protein
MRLQAEIQEIMNSPMLNTDIAKLAAAAGAMEAVDPVKDVIMPMIIGLQNAVMRLAAEIEDDRGPA